MNELVAVEDNHVAHESRDDHDDYLTVFVGKQLFGIPALTVQDVLGPRKIAHVPLAPKEIAGSINLRGRIVTVLDARSRLGMPPQETDERAMNVVVEHDGELYSLLVDKVGDVLSMPPDTYEDNPSTLSTDWREFAKGVYRLETDILVVFDVGSLFRLGA